MLTVVCAMLLSEQLTGQQSVPSANVNVISGIGPDGDWTLQRQNEPSGACSFRNPQNCLVGANDYRSVDIPFPNDAGRVIGDAWLGWYTTKDGGLTWRTRLLPGFPQDVSPEGLASPLKGTHAGADPVVRSGAFGMFFYSGITFNRGPGGGSKVFVARFIDHNDRERPDVDSIVYLDTKVIQSAPDGTVTNFFIDKPWLVVDVPRTGNGSCQIATRGKAKGKLKKTQSLPCARLFLAYTVFGGPQGNQRGTIMTTWSGDNGETWSKPKPLGPDLDVNDDGLINNADAQAVKAARGQRCQTAAYNPALDVNVDCVVDRMDETAIAQGAGTPALAPGYTVDQGAAVAVAPTSGNVYIAWRQFMLGAGLNALFISKSVDGGQTYSAPVLVSTLAPFDQQTGFTTFRSSALPSLAIDDLERLYLTWTTRGLGTFHPSPITGDARVVVATSPDGVNWSAPQPIDNHSGPGHQFMPSIVFAAGQLQLLYYDQREDASGLFGPWVDESPIIEGPSPRIRHTTEVRAAHATPGLSPSFTSLRISDYLVGVPPGGNQEVRLQYHPPNLPMFVLGTSPFMGDYIDIVPSQPMVQQGDQIVFNSAPSASPLFHAFWTDNRDVRPPPDGDWTKYTPPNPPFARPTTSGFDPTQTIPACTPGFVATRNQNIYTARVSRGLVAAALTNSKQLSPTLSRSFPIYVQNNTLLLRSYRMTIRTPPPGGSASFDQFSLIESLDVQVPPRSTVARSVHATSSDPRAMIPVDVVEITAPGGTVISGGQAGEIVLNPDPSNPDVANPDVANPDVANPDVANPDVANAEVFNPDVANGTFLGQANPDVANPDVANPDVANVLVVNPSVVTADPGAPDVANPDVANPDVANPDVANTDLVSGALSDTTWTMTNRGNTAASYAVKLLLNRALPPGFRSQLIVHRIYQTPTVLECELKQQTQNVLLVNLPDPSFTTGSELANPDVANPDVANVTVAIPPGEQISVTLRVYDPNRFDSQTFDAVAAVTPAMVSHSVDTVALAQGDTTPQVAAPLLPPAPEPPAAPVGGSYSYTPPPPPTGPGNWSIVGGSLPPGLTLNTATGAITGTPTTSGEFTFILRFVDGNGIEDFQTITIQVAAPAVFANVGISISDTPDPAVLASPLTYTMLVSNAGPAAAANVTTTQSLPAGAELVSVTPSQGTCTVSTTVNCTLGSIATGATASIVVVVTPGSADSANSTASVNSSTPDPNTANNTAASVTLIQAFAACLSPTFSGPRFFPTGIAGNFTLSLGDFNSDGTVDALSSQTNALTVLPGDGTGGFGSAVTIALGTAPAGLALGDFNEDGQLDVVVSGSSFDMPVLLGTGNGAFTAAASIAAGFASFVADPGDFNNDGNLDVIVGGTAGQMAFVAGNGDGTFDAPVITTIGTGTIQFVVADFNSDGLLDAAASDRGTSLVSLLTGNGAGGFTSTLTLNPGAGARLRQGLGDVNNDGNPDLSVTLGNSPAQQSLIYLGNGTGGFAAPIDALAGGTAQYTSAADINGDGLLDYVAIHPTVGRVGVQIGAIGPTFGPVASFATAQANHLRLADINGDLKPDIVLATGGAQGGVSVLLNNCSPTPADLAVVANDTPDPIAPGGVVTYSMTVANNGPNPASGVLATAALQNQPHIVSATASQGSCSFIDLQATCDLGTLASGASATVSVDASSSLAGSTFSATVGATSDQADPNAANSALTLATAVSGAPVPTITTVVPGSGPQGGTLDIAITGQNTNFVQDQTSATFGLGITVNTVTVASPTSATANISIDPTTTTTGARDVTLTTGTEIVTRTAGFSVTSGGAFITQIGPASAQQGQSLSVEITGNATHFATGITTVSLGRVGATGAINVTNVVVTSPTTLTAQLSVTPDATPGLWSVSAVTEGETAVFLNAFTVVGTTATVSNVAPNQGLQGQTLDVAVTGQATSFAQGQTTATFGPGITANSVTVNSATSATVNITIAPTAFTGLRDVTMTTGTEIATLANGFTVAFGPALIAQLNPNFATQGQSLPVQVTGQATHFAQGVTTADFGPNITVNSVTVTSETTATADITIAALAAPGARTVTLTTQGELASNVNGFTVQSVVPVVTGTTPSTAQQGQTLDVVVSAQNTNFEQGVTSASFGVGVTINSVTVASPTSATVNLSVDPIAAAGNRSVQMTTGTEVATGALFSVTAGPAVLTQLSPNSADQGETVLVSIIGQGTHFADGVTTASVNGGGVSAGVVTVTSATTASVSLTVAPLAATGARTVTLTTVGEQASLVNGFTINAATPVIASANPDSGAQNATLDVVVTGQLTNFQQGVTTASFGAGITVNTVSVTSPTTATVNITISPIAFGGGRTITLTTGAESAQSAGNAFTVLGGNAALLSVNPTSGQQGTTLDVAITGSSTHFSQALSTASFGPGIIVNQLTVASATSATANISILAQATIGTRTVVVSTAGEIAEIDDGFSVTAGQASIVAVNPPTGRQAETLDVQVTGQLTNFVQGTTTASFGAGIVVNSVTVSGPLNAAANVSIDPGAALGSRTVTLTTGTEVASSVGGFTVLAGLPTLLSVNPIVGTQGESLTVVLNGAFTNFTQDVSTVSFGSGISVGTVTVNGPTLASVPITISPFATVGSRSVTVTTGTEVATLVNGFTVIAGTPVLTVIDPNIGRPNENTTVIVTAAFTSFQQGVTMASFGADVSVNGGAAGALALVNVVSATQFTAELSIAAGAQLGPRNVVVQTGPENLTAAGGFTITDVEAIPPSVFKVSPANSATDVPLNTRVQVEFSEPIDRTTVTATSFVLRDNTTFLPVPATVSVDVTGRVATLIPSQLLAVNRGHSVLLSGGPTIRDASGNAMSFQSPSSFTTGFATDTAGPSFVTMSIANGDSDVPLNTDVALEFSKPINPISQPLGAQVQLAGVPVPGTYTFSAGNQILTFQPASPLAASTLYDVVLSNQLTDAAGNSLANPDTFSFTTGTVSDNTAGTVVASNPNSGASGVGINTLLRATFSERIDPTSVSTGFVRVVHAATGRIHPAEVTVAPDRRSLTLTTDEPLRPETSYSWQVFSLKDLAGNFFGGFSAFFTTASGVDILAPTVASISPVDDALDVPVNVRVVVEMSEAIDPTSVPGSVQLTPAVTGTLTLSGGTTLTLVPAAPLAVSTQYDVTVSGLRDLTGHGLPQPVTSTFTTRAAATADTTAPTVVQTVPANGQTGVAVNSQIEITISEPIVASAVDENSVRVLANVPGLGFVQVAGTLSVDPAATVITFIPLTPYPGNTSITLQVNSNSTIDDLAGNNLTFASRTFTTAAAADTTAPAIVSVMPLNGTVNVGLNAVVTLTFSESLAPNSVNNTTFALFADGQPHGVSITRSSDNRTVMLHTTLPADSLITVVATSDVTDLAGNALADFTSTFSTTANVDTTTGQVVTVRPASGATNVPPTTPLTVFLTKPVDSTTVPTALWVAQNGVLVTGGVSVTGGGTAIHFVPTAPFAPGAFVQVFLEGVVDQSGNAVPSFQASFTIASNPLTTVANVVRVAPTGTDVPVNAVAEIEISEPINAATAIPANVRLLDQSFQVLPSTISLRAGDRVIRLVPTNPLAANQTTFIQVLSGLQDVQGQSVSGTLASFTTGSAVDDSAPSVMAVTPPNGVTDIGINALVRVSFNEPINPLTVSADTIQVMAGGFVAVPASFSFNPGDTEVTLTSVQPLPDASVLTITISGVQDRAGLNVTPLTTSFTTRTGADTRGPTLLSASVSASQTGVPVNSVFVGEFDEPLDPQSVSGQSVVLRDNIFFVPVPATVALNPDGRSVTLAPTSALSVGRSYSLFFNFNTVLRDLAGNASSGTSVSFITSFQPDATAPTILASNPVTGDVNIPTNVRLKILFDEPIDANTLDGITLNGGTPLPTTAALSNGNRLLSISRPTLLSASTPHTLTLTGLRDTSGNQMAPVPITFTTGAGADLFVATVIASNPDPSDTNVGVNTVMRAVFSEPIDPTTLLTALVRVVHSATGSIHPAVVSVAADRRSLILTPTEPLLGSRAYSFQIFGLFDVAGNAVNGFSAPFVTAPAADNTAPTVSSISPASGTLDVPVNVRIVLRMSEAIDPTSLPGAVQLTPNVNATLTRSTDGTTLTLVPLNPLAVSTSYGVAVSALRDLAGNEMPPFASTFTTRAVATADITSPTVVQTVPASGATGVAVDSQIVITISEPIVASAVNTDSVRVFASVPGLGSVQLAGSLSVDPTATVITFTPLTPYPGDTQILLQVNANSTIDDLAGNNLAFSSRTFTTAAATDTTPPTVVGVTPLSGTLNVGLNTIVALTFSESLAPATVDGTTFHLFAGAQQLNPSVTRSSDNRTVTLSASLPPEALITVVVTTGVTDLAGNALADFTSTFVTGATVDTTFGHVVTVRPASGATNVPASTSLTLYLTKPVDAASVAPALWVATDGVLVTGTTTVSGGGTAIHFVPTVPFAPSAFVQIFLDGAQDTSGNVIQVFQASFTVAGNPLTTAPTVVRVSPTGTNVPMNAEVEIEISEPIEPDTAIGPNVRLLDQSFQVLPSTISLRANNRIIRLVPTNPLAANQTTFIQVLSGLTDEQGQPVNGFFSFTTGTTADAVAPAVEAISPPNGATNVGINALVRVRFSEPINPLTVTGDTIQITASGFTAAPASISFSASDTEVAVTPLQPLPDGTVLTISVNGVEDRAGHGVTTVTTTFTTRTGADIRLPILAGASVFASQTGVPVNSVFVGEFDEQLDPISVNTQSVALRDNSTFQAVPVTVALNPDGRTITLTPTSSLAINHSYTVFFNFSTGLRDLVGNQAPGTSVTFTTSSNSDTSPPAVLLTVPNDNLTGVPTNTRVLALFDEPVDATQLEQVLLLQGVTPLVVTRALSNGNRTLTLTPSTLLAPNTAHTLLIAGIPDTAGNVMVGATQATFTTGPGIDLTRPLVTTFAPLHNTSSVPVNVAPQVTFNEPIDPLSVPGNVVLRLTATSVVVPVVYGFSADFRTVTLTPTAPLADGTQYTIAVTNFSVRDLAGNFIANSGTANFVTQ